MDHTHIIRVTKYRRMRWAVHVARLGHMRSSYEISVENPRRER